MNTDLERPFTKEEIKESLFSMHPLKAPGVDGMPALFYQKYWHVVGESVYQTCLEFLNDDGDLCLLNHTLIALIPKVKEPKLVIEFRPISLCTVLYKIVSKAIANRLKTWLPTIKLEEKSSCVPGRQLTDNVLVAFETMHKIQMTKSGKLSYLALKLDMSKAYDRVEWKFLESIMHQMGFASRWI